MFSSPPGTSATEGVPVAHQGSIPVTHVSGNIFQFQGSHAEGSQSSNTRVILDPPKSTTKGRPREKRFQHPFDIAKPKKRGNVEYAGQQNMINANVPQPSRTEKCKLDGH